VQWYELEDQPEASQLAHISFPPLSDDRSFRFLDSDDVLQACHVIPLFQLGLACKNGPGLLVVKIMTIQIGSHILQIGGFSI